MRGRHTAMLAAATAVLTMAAVAVAEDLTLSTYYASPRGVYRELRTMDNTSLAIQAGTVGIGTQNPNPAFKLHVVGTIGMTQGGNTGDMKFTYCGPPTCPGATAGWYAAYAP